MTDTEKRDERLAEIWLAYTHGLKNEIRRLAIDELHLLVEDMEKQPSPHLFHYDQVKLEALAEIGYRYMLGRVRQADAEGWRLCQAHDCEISECAPQHMQMEQEDGDDEG